MCGWWLLPPITTKTTSQHLFNMYQSSPLCLNLLQMWSEQLYVSVTEFAFCQLVVWTVETQCMNPVSLHRVLRYCFFLSNSPQFPPPTTTHSSTYTKNTQTRLPAIFMHQNEKQQGVLILTGGSGGICNFLSATNYSSNKTQEKWRLLV